MNIKNKTFEKNVNTQDALGWIGFSYAVSSVSLKLLQEKVIMLTNNLYLQLHSNLQFRGGGGGGVDRESGKLFFFFRLYVRSIY